MSKQKFKLDMCGFCLTCRVVTETDEIHSEVPAYSKSVSVLHQISLLENNKYFRNFVSHLLLQRHRKYVPLKHQPYIYYVTLLSEIQIH